MQNYKQNHSIGWKKRLLVQYEVQGIYMDVYKLWGSKKNVELERWLSG